MIALSLAVETACAVAADSHDGNMSAGLLLDRAHGRIRTELAGTFYARSGTPGDVLAIAPPDPRQLNELNQTGRPIRNEGPFPGSPSEHGRYGHLSPARRRPPLVAELGVLPRRQGCGGPAAVVEGIFTEAR